jgi:hypothetical protein
MHSLFLGLRHKFKERLESYVRPSGQAACILAAASIGQGTRNTKVKVVSKNLFRSLDLDFIGGGIFGALFHIEYIFKYSATFQTSDITLVY